MKLSFESQELAELFDKTWQRIPAADRAKLADVLVMVTDSPAFRKRAPGGGRGFGYTDVAVNGYFIWLAADELLQLADELAQGVIAHELAHVFRGHAAEAIVLLQRGHSDKLAELQPLFESEAEEVAQGRWGFTNTAGEVNWRKLYDSLGGNDE